MTMSGKITGSHAPLHDHLARHSSAVISLSDEAHEVDEGATRVEVLGAELRGRVVHGECVVVVVETLADGAQAHEQVLGRVDGLVVWAVAPHVRNAVHQPCDVQ